MEVPFSGYHAGLGTFAVGRELSFGEIILPAYLECPQNDVTLLPTYTPLAVHTGALQGIFSVYGIY